MAAHRLAPRATCCGVYDIGNGYKHAFSSRRLGRKGWRLNDARNLSTGRTKPWQESSCNRSGFWGKLGLFRTPVFPVRRISEARPPGGFLCFWAMPLSTNRPRRNRRSAASMVPDGLESGKALSTIRPNHPRQVKLAGSASLCAARLLAF